MKRIISVLTVTVMIMFWFSGYTYAADGRAYSFESKLTPETITKYVSSHSSEISEYISSELDKAAMIKPDLSDMEIKVGQVFTIPTYFAKTDKIQSSLGNSYTSAVYSDGEVIGLLHYMFNALYVDTDLTDYIYISFEYLSENSNRSYDNGISFFRYVTGEAEYDNIIAGNIFSILPDNSISGVCCSVDDNRADEEQINLYENILIQPVTTPKYSDISKYNNVSKVYGEIIGFNYKPFEHSLKSGNADGYYIRCKTGKYLTYKNGKYYMSEYSAENAENQKFTLTLSENGSGYNICPILTQDKPMSFNGIKNLSIQLSSFNEYCVTIGSENYKLTDTGNNVVFARYHTNKHDYFRQDWFIDPVKKQ